MIEPANKVHDFPRTLERFLLFVTSRIESAQKLPFFNGLVTVLATISIYFLCWRIFVYQWHVPPPSISSISDILNITFSFVTKGFWILLVTGSYFFVFLIYPKRSEHSIVERLSFCFLLVLIPIYSVVYGFDSEDRLNGPQVSLCVFIVFFFGYLFNFRPGEALFDRERNWEFFEPGQSPRDWIERELKKYSMNKVCNVFAHIGAFFVNSLVLAFYISMAYIWMVKPILWCFTAIEGKIVRQGFYGEQVTSSNLTSELVKNCSQGALLWLGERNAVFRCSDGKVFAIATEKVSDVTFGEKANPLSAQ